MGAIWSFGSPQILGKNLEIELMGFNCSLPTPTTPTVPQREKIKKQKEKKVVTKN